MHVQQSRECDEVIDIERGPPRHQRIPDHSSLSDLRRLWLPHDPERRFDQRITLERGIGDHQGAVTQRRPEEILTAGWVTMP